MRPMIFSLILLFCSGQLRADAPATQPSQQQAHLPGDIALQDLNDRAITPLDMPSGHRAAVLIFISTDCPICNSYAPLIADLYRAFSPHGIDFYTVYEDSNLTASAAIAHHDTYAFPCDALLDSQQKLAHLTGALVTPEAFVVGTGGAVLYHGRIDNQYVTVGRKRFAATTQELKDALTQLAADQPVTVSPMPAVGCAIP